MIDRRALPRVWASVAALMISAVAVVLALSTSASSSKPGGAHQPAGVKASVHRVSVHVPGSPHVGGDVAISFRPTSRLPRGGYYYAAVVLENYPGYSSASPPGCAVSSNMRQTAYGYPHGGHPVRLILLPAPSSTGLWCAGGIYHGALYAVPHRPRCSGSYP